jgi:hypothetical protein
LARQNESGQHRIFGLRGFVYLLPILCVISLAVRVGGRLNGWKEDPHGPDRGTLVLGDWATRRADLELWLEQQAAPQLVFVRYSRRHNVNNEWVYNHANIMTSNVIWARDLGAEHNKLLLNLLPDRMAWLLDADTIGLQLIPYSKGDSNATAPSLQFPATNNSTEQDQ